MITHVIPCNAEAVTHGRFFALCGELVLTTEGASGTPTCPVCRRLELDDFLAPLRARVRELEAGR